MLRAREHRQVAAIQASRGALRFCRRHPLARSFCTTTHRRYFKARIRWTEPELAETRAALAPPPPPPPPSLPSSIPHLSAWLCIHRHEGAWDDPNGKYYGGLQMDMDFMRSYGAALLETKGTADHWTPEEQMQVAEKAYASGRGFYPWPNTARYCGLL